MVVKFMELDRIFETATLDVYILGIMDDGHIDLIFVDLHKVVCRLYVLVLLQWDTHNP